MKLLQRMKSIFAGTVAAAMILTSVPTAVFAEEAAPDSVNPILHWDMTQDSDGKLKDLTENGHAGVTNGSLSFGEIDGIKVLNLTGGYVDIPDGTISSDATEVTINMLVKITENNPGSWMFCLGASNKRYLYFTGCCSSRQGSKMRGGIGCVPTENISSGFGYNYESFVTGDQALTPNIWQNVTITYKDGGDFTFYLNGEIQNNVTISDGSAGSCTLQDLMIHGTEPNTDRDGYMGWSFYTGNDPKFQGAVADFRIYEKEMTAEEVTALEGEIEDKLSSLKEGDFSEADINLSEADCLGENTSKNEISTNLSLPTATTIGEAAKEAAIDSWTSSNPAVISNDGTVTPPLKTQTVTMTAAVTMKGNTVNKTLTFKVPGTATDADLLQMDKKALRIPTAEEITGNIELPSKGENGSSITWTSSNENVIRSTKNGKIPAGQVTRQAEDTQVTLTASLTYGKEKTTKEIVCTVKKAPKEIVTTDYLFAYFPYTSIKDERIYFGISEDGLNFKSLNDSKPVLESTLGTHGLRDPFIFRSHEGDKFYLIATDLTVAGITQNEVKYPGMSWDKNQTQGSQSIMVWESEDLVNWSEQRMCKVAADTAGCTWAPEAYWDDATEQYVVFWASKTADDNYAKHRVWYATTRDFYTFSPAKVWIEESGSVIDTTVIKAADGYYYRYTKNEDGAANQYGTPSKRIYCERSKSLTSANWTLVHNNSLNVGGGQIEGGCIFKINTDDVENAKKIAALKGYTLEGNDIYSLIADMTGATIFPGLSSDISTGSFDVLGTSANASVDGVNLYTMPEPSASHGTIMPITAEEYDNLMAKYDTAYAAALTTAKTAAETAAASVTLDTVSAVTENLTLPAAAADGTAITWTSSDASVIAPDGTVTRPEYSAGNAAVTLTAAVSVPIAGTNRSHTVSKTFTVTVSCKEKPADNPSGSNPSGDNPSGGNPSGGNPSGGNPSGGNPSGGNPSGTAPVTYTVTFSDGSKTISTASVAANSAVSAPKAPVKKKYTFDGWYANGQKYDFNAPVSSDLTITAKWKKVSVSKAKWGSVTNKKTKTATASVKKVSGAKGYQFVLATDKKFKKGVKKTTTTKTSASFKKLKKGKTYYVRVRAYKMDSAKQKIYGSYSSVKKIKIKK